MPLVHFEMINSEGVLERRLIPSEKIAFIRPLSTAEQEFAAKMRDGTYSRDLILNCQSRDPIHLAAEHRMDVVTAQIYKKDVTDASVQSILQTSDGTRYCLLKSVDDLAACAANLCAGSVIALTPIADPARPGSTVGGPASTKVQP